MFTLIQQANATEVAAPGQPGPVSGLFPIILIFMIFYFFVIRPQHKKIKEHQNMVKAIKKGDVIVTSGGIYGKVQKVNDETLEVEIAKSVVIQVAKATVSNVSDKKFSAIGADAKQKTTKAKKK